MALLSGEEFGLFLLTVSDGACGADRYSNKRLCVCDADRYSNKLLCVCGANRYSNKRLCFCSLPKGKALFYGRESGSGRGPKLVRKIVGFRLWCAPDKGTEQKYVK